MNDFWKHRGHGEAEPNWPVLAGMLVGILLILLLILL